jgi:hypothetical protein
MKGDFTRSTFRAKKHYSSVRMQQGRLQLDADWNEQADIQTYLLQTRSQDIIGICGAPEDPADDDRSLPPKNFKIHLTPDGQDLVIGAGHIYVDGILCELDNETKYTEQNSYRNAKAIDVGEELKDGDYLAYLDVWQRHISAINDPEIREVALNGADTATRTQTIAQVKLALLDQSDPQTFLAQKKRDAKLTAASVSATSITETHLYRIEIHQGGGIDTATFKWSRENGTIVSAIDTIKDNVITITPTSYDLWQSSQPDQWLEIIDEVRELAGQPGTLVRLEQIFENKLVCDGTRVLDSLKNSLFKPVTQQEASDRKLKVRRWDYTSDTSDPTNSGGIPISEQWIQLGNEGIQVKFDASSVYATGDYWLIPTRAITRDIEWSRDPNNPDQTVPQSFEGIHHHYCPLAKLTCENKVFQADQIQELRKTFSPLIEKGLIKGNIGLEDSEKQAMLHVKGEAAKEATGGTLHPSDSPDELDVSADPSLLHVGDTIVIGDQQNLQKTVITGISQKPGVFNIAPPLTIIDITPFRYQQPIARFASSDGATQIIATADGRLGIGTEGPKEALDVKGTIAAEQIKLPPTGVFEVGILKAQELQLQKAQADRTQLLYSSFKTEETGNTKQVQFIANRTQNVEFAFRDGNVRLTNPDTKIPIELSIGSTTLKNTDDQLSIDSNVTIQGKEGTTASLTVGALVLNQSLKFTNGQLVNRISTDSTFQNSNHETLSTQLAIKTYVDTQIQNRAFVSGSSVVNFNTRDLMVTGGLTLAQGARITEISTRSNLQDSNLAVPTEKAVKDFVENRIQEAIDSPQLNIENFIARTLTLTGTGITPTVARSSTDQTASLSVRGLPAIPGNFSEIQPRKISSNTAMQMGGIVTIANQAPRLITAVDRNSFTVTPPFDAALTADTLQYQSAIAAFTDSNGKNQFTVTANGSVLIGALDQDPPVELSTSLLDTKLYVNGRVFGKDIRGDIQQLSSRELKNNITELSSQEAKQLLESLNPIKFVYNNDDDQTVRVGFISEEVPEIVATSDRKAISPLDVVAVLTKAVRDQQQTTATLIRLLDQQQREIIRLQEQVRMLEQQPTKRFWSL